MSKRIVLKESGAQTTGTVTGEKIVIERDEDTFQEATFVLDITALATETADKLDVYVDVSPDNGSTWVNAIHFTQADGDGSTAKEVAKLTADALGDPDATLVVTSDAAESVVRNIGMIDCIRYRGVVTNDGTDNASFTYSLVASYR